MSGHYRNMSFDFYFLKITVTLKNGQNRTVGEDREELDSSCLTWDRKLGKPFGRPSGQYLLKLDTHVPQTKQCRSCICPRKEKNTRVFIV